MSINYDTYEGHPTIIITDDKSGTKVILGYRKAKIIMNHIEGLTKWVKDQEYLKEKNKR